MKNNIILFNIKNQLTQIFSISIFSILLASISIGLTIFIARLTDSKVWQLAKDPAETVGFPPYIGMLSNWGALLWMSAAVICLFTATLIKKHKKENPNYAFILFSGILSFFLAVDDLFLLHDKVFPSLFGIREAFFYLLYFVILTFYLFYFRHQIVQYPFLLLAIAFLSFITRQISDFIPFFDQFVTSGDMLKHFGIVFWLAFFYRVASQELSYLIQTNPKH